ncbi:MAG TPA: SDR family NAD(P)-dependent oxidoreductase [Dissulfurispiraceae bacterium]|nr:SDR family NAD(P)-dependent oxidoreductase [Dissulfurispiraceae bacterium]
MNRAGKVILITGATGGLGGALAKTFAGLGWHMALLYHSAEERMQALCAEIGGDRTLALQVDVRNARALEKAEKAVMAWRVRLDAIICNAGIAHDAPLSKQRERDWDDMQSVNLSGAFRTIRAFAPYLSRGGHIIVISSFSGLKGKAGQAAYSATKAGLLGLTKTAAAELGQSGICVNAVLPGYLPVGMGPRSQAAMERARYESLLGCLSDAEEAAGFIAHLISMKRVTGQTFCLDSRII